MRNPELRDKSGLTEAEFLARYNAGDYERPSVAADLGWVAVLVEEVE